MNRLQKHEGGQPIYMDDLIFLQGNSLGAIASSNEAVFGAKTMIISGLTTADAGLTYSSGVVMVDGILYNVEAYAAAQPATYLVIERTDYEIRKFKNGEQKAVYEGFSARLSSVAPAAAHTTIALSDMIRRYDRIDDTNSLKNLSYSVEVHYLAPQSYIIKLHCKVLGDTGASIAVGSLGEIVVPLQIAIPYSVRESVITEVYISENLKLGASKISKTGSDFTLADRISIYFTGSGKVYAGATYDFTFVV